MAKKIKQDLPADLVPHPRYGAAPRPSRIVVAEDEIRHGHWRYGKAEIFPETVLVADTEKQNYSIYPRKYYVDILQRCRDCRRPFIFFALEQRYWYETLGFYIDADCVMCPDCRRDAQGVKRRLRRYSDLLAKECRTQKDLMFLVEDGVYLLDRGILRDLNSLGRLKNVALKEIPEFGGTEMLAQAISNARQAQNQS